MTKGTDIRELALGILLEVSAGEEYSHIALRNVLDKYQYLEKQERAFLTRLVEGTLERRIELDYIIDQFSSVKVRKQKPVIRELLRMSVYQLKYMDSVPDSAVCNEAVKLAQKKGFRQLKGFVNGVLRNIARNLSTTMSCGCYRKMQKAMPNGELRLHRIWANMKQRCANPKSKDFKYYGAKGVSVCAEWEDFETFFYWAMSHGYKDGLTIERIDNGGDYCPNNCKWIPKHRQNSNTSRTKRYVMYGKVFTLAEICRIYGVSRSTVASRLKKGIPLEKAIKQNRRYQMNTKLLELSDRLKELRTQKSDLEREVKGINEEIDGVITEMIDLMTTEELTSFNRNGMTFSLVTQEYPAPEPERKGELWEVMKKNGFEDLFTINSQTLSATVKELIAANEGVLPEWLDGLIKIAEKNSIRVAKSKNY